MTYIERTERVGDLIVQIKADDSGLADPRDNDNVTEIVFLHRRYILGDRQSLTSGEEQAIEHGGIAALRKHLARQPEGLIALTKIGMYDHSGITIYTVEDAGNGHAPLDEAGWDSGIVGFAYVTRKRWAEIMADTDPAAPYDGDGVGKGKTWADAVIAQEVSEYDDWLTGNVWGFTITKPCDQTDEHDTDEEIADCPHAEEIGSCWGFIGDPSYAWNEAKAEAEAMAVTP